MAGNHVLLETISLTQSAASVTLDNIPQTGYTDLKIVVSARSNRADTDDIILMKPNNSSSNLTYRALTANGSTASSGTVNRFYVDGDTFTANTFANVEIYIPNFTSSNYKSWSLDSVTENNGTTAYSALMAGLWSDTTAISSLIFAPIYGTAFTANSTFSLYGVADVHTTPVIAPQATGGNIVGNDGTYWYHTFLTSGTFTPQTSLSCDALVVAGGGGGGHNNGGGGGAGGFRTATGFSVTAQTYAITVGAGGANTNVNNVNAGSGTDSVFSTITSTGGGYGSTISAQPGANGGSGGGGRYNAGAGTGNTPSTSPSQGNNGGAGANYVGGGGGGAGAVGGNASSNVAAAGGNGTSNSYSGSAVTYAGGGGGGGDGDRSPGSPGAGGTGGGGAGGRGQTGGAGANNNGTAGTVNSGGGGGGTGGYTTTSGAGGSGIVIIRYAMV